MLLDPADGVWLENPGGLGARNALAACGASLVPVDGHGLDVAAGECLAAGCFATRIGPVMFSQWTCNRNRSIFTLSFGRAIAGPSSPRSHRRSKTTHTKVEE